MKKIDKNDYWFSISSRIFIILIGVLTTSFSARYLNVSLRGEFGFITQAVNVLVIVLGLGFQQTYTYFYRKYNKETFPHFNALYLAQLLFYLFAALVVMCIFRSGDLFYIALTVPFAVTYNQLETAMTVEQLRLKIRRQRMNALLKCIFYAALYFFRGVIGIHLLYPVLITIGIDMLTIALYWVKPELRPSFRSFQRSFAKETVIFSFLPMITSLLIIMNYSVDIFFLKYMGSNDDLSWYTIAAGIINYVWLLPDAVRDVLSARIAREDNMKAINLSIKLSVHVVCLLGIGFWLIGHWAINLLYGAAFAESYGVTLILFIGSISMVFFKMIGVLALAEGKRKLYFLTLAISVLANAACNFYAIPRWGMYGAAWASVISYSICGIAFLCYYLHAKKQKLYDVLFLTKSDLSEFRTHKK